MLITCLLLWQWNGSRSQRINLQGFGGAWLVKRATTPANPLIILAVAADVDAPLWILFLTLPQTYLTDPSMSLRYRWFVTSLTDVLPPPFILNKGLPFTLFWGQAGLNHLRKLVRIIENSLRLKAFLWCGDHIIRVNDIIVVADLLADHWFLGQRYLLENLRSLILRTVVRTDWISRLSIHLSHPRVHRTPLPAWRHLNPRHKGRMSGVDLDA